MNQISEIISMPLISLYDGENLGIVSNILFNNNLKKAFACIVDQKSYTTQILQLDDIFKIGKDCIYIKNKSKLKLKDDMDFELEKSLNPINLQVFDFDGNYIGNIQDIILSCNYKVKAFVLNDNISITPEQVFNLGQNVLIISNNSKITPLKFKPNQRIKKPTILNSKDNRVTILAESKTQTVITTNHKIITDHRFLIGRILNQDIKTMNGEIIARKNAVITKEIIQKASLFGKLVEVARYS